MLDLISLRRREKGKYRLRSESDAIVRPEVDYLGASFHSAAAAAANNRPAAGSGYTAEPNHTAKEEVLGSKHSWAVRSKGK